MAGTRFDYRKILADREAGLGNKHRRYAEAGKHLYGGTPKGAPAPRFFYSATHMMREQGGYLYYYYGNPWGLSYDVCRVNKDNIVEFLLDPKDIREYDLSHSYSAILQALGCGGYLGRSTAPRHGKGVYVFHSKHSSGGNSVIYRGLKYNADTGMFLNPIPVDGLKHAPKVERSREYVTARYSISKKVKRLLDTAQSAIVVGGFDEHFSKLTQTNTYDLRAGFIVDYKELICDAIDGKITVREYVTLFSKYLKAYKGETYWRQPGINATRIACYTRHIVQSDVEYFVRAAGYKGEVPVGSTIEDRVDHKIKEMRA